jgi:hypothetical protein
VIDSITALFRASDEFASFKENQYYLTEIGNILTRLARTFSMTIIVTNQVSADFQQDSWNQYRMISEEIQRPFLLQRDPLLTLEVRQDQTLFSGGVRKVTSLQLLPSSYNRPKDLPAMGLKWSRFINSRIQLTRKGQNRFLHLIYSPNAQCTTETNIPCTFRISEDGIIGEGLD